MDRLGNMLPGFAADDVRDIPLAHREHFSQGVLVGQTGVIKAANLPHLVGRELHPADAVLLGHIESVRAAVAREQVGLGAVVAHAERSVAGVAGQSVSERARAQFVGEAVGSDVLPADLQLPVALDPATDPQPTRGRVVHFLDEAPEPNLGRDHSRTVEAGAGADAPLFALEDNTAYGTHSVAILADHLTKDQGY